MNVFKFLTEKVGPMKLHDENRVMFLMGVVLCYTLGFSFWIAGYTGEEFPVVMTFFCFLGAAVGVLLAISDIMITEVSKTLTRDRGTIRYFFHNMMVPEDLKDDPAAMPFSSLAFTYGVIMATLGFFINLPIIAIITTLLIITFFVVRKKIDHYYDEGRS